VTNLGVIKTDQANVGGEHKEVTQPLAGKVNSQHSKMASIKILPVLIKRLQRSNYEYILSGRFRKESSLVTKKRKGALPWKLQEE
jgi:hypothetical protein